MDSEDDTGRGFRRWWAALELNTKVAIVVGATTVLIALGQLYFDWYGSVTGGPQGEPSPTTTLEARPPSTISATSVADSVAPAEQFEFDPRLSSSPTQTYEGTSSVFFDEGSTVRIGQIDDETTVAGSVTAYLPGQAQCRWLQVNGEGKLTYRVGSGEYEITVDLPSTSYADIRVAKRIAGEPSGTLPCEPVG